MRGPGIVAPPQADSIGCIRSEIQWLRANATPPPKGYTPRRSCVACASLCKLELGHFAVGQHLAREMEEERAVTDDSDAAFGAREKK